ncbi:MAG: hypothetical protein EPO11_04910 [Gammaproteobacteria bacterium]|nr:MAG: hypothetical protein EPO11_04910 [Gammaproteobacteria bacterium]
MASLEIPTPIDELYNVQAGLTEKMKLLAERADYLAKNLPKKYATKENKEMLEKLRNIATDLSRFSQLPTTWKSREQKIGGFADYFLDDKEENFKKLMNRAADLMLFQEKAIELIKNIDSVSKDAVLKSKINNPKNASDTLENLIVAPMQMSMKYKNLIGEMLKTNKMSSKLKEGYKDALELVDTLVDKSNKRKKMLDEKEKFTTEIKEVTDIIEGMIKKSHKNLPKMNLLKQVLQEFNEEIKWGDTVASKMTNSLSKLKYSISKEEFNILQRQIGKIEKKAEKIKKESFLSTLNDILDNLNGTLKSINESKAKGLALFTPQEEYLVNARIKLITKTLNDFNSDPNPHRIAHMLEELKGSSFISGTGHFEKINSLWEKEKRSKTETKENNLSRKNLSNQYLTEMERFKQEVDKIDNQVKNYNDLKASNKLTPQEIDNFQVWFEKALQSSDCKDYLEYTKDKNVKELMGVLTDLILKVTDEKKRKSLEYLVHKAGFDLQKELNKVAVERIDGQLAKYPEYKKTNPAEIDGLYNWFYKTMNSSYGKEYLKDSNNVNKFAKALVDLLPRLPEEKQKVIRSLAGENLQKQINKGMTEKRISDMVEMNISEQLNKYPEDKKRDKVGEFFVWFAQTLQSNSTKEYLQDDKNSENVKKFARTLITFIPRLPEKNRKDLEKLATTAGLNLEKERNNMVREKINISSKSAYSPKLFQVRPTQAGGVNAKVENKKNDEKTTEAKTNGPRKT